MILTLNENELQHMDEISLYNYNFYKIQNNYMILEKCLEDYGYYNYYLFKNHEEITFIGYSENGMEDGVVNIEFMKEYT